MKKILMTAMFAVMLTVFTACHWHDDDDRLVEQIVGHWVADYDYDGYRTYDCWGADEYQFHYDGNGEYYYYDEWGTQRVLYFTWDVNRTRIELWYSGGGSDYFYYEWDRDGDLLLSTDRNLREYRAYRYMR